MLRQADPEFVRAGDADALRGRGARRERLRGARQVSGVVVHRARERARRTAERGRATRRRSPRVRPAGQEREPRRQPQPETDERADHGLLLADHLRLLPPRRAHPAASGGCNAAGKPEIGQLGKERAVRAGRVSDGRHGAEFSLAKGDRSVADASGSSVSKIAAHACGSENRFRLSYT